MKLTKRILPTAAVALAAAMLMAGCSSSPAAPSTSTAKAKPSGAIQLSYWGSSTRVAKYNQIDQLFQQKYPGVQVQAAAGDFATYFQKLNVQAASKSMPCVTTMQTRQLNDYTSNGTMMDLDPLVKSGQINVSDIPKSVLDTGRGPDGKLYMVPFGVAWNALTTNSALAKQNGIPLLKDGYSWAQYGDWLKTAASKLPKGVVAVNDEGQDEALFSAYVISNGYKMFNDKGKIGFPKSVLTDFWNTWQKYAKAGYTTTPQQSADEPSQLEQFNVTSGKVLAEDTAGNALPGIQAANPSANMVTNAFPKGKTGLGNMFFVSGYSIPTSCNNVSTAAAYIDFWTNNDQAATVFNSDNGAVANGRQLKDQVTAATPGVKTVLKEYQYILSQKVPTQTIPSGYNAVFEQSFKRHYQDVAFGRSSVSQAVDGFFSDANASLGAK